MYVDVCIVGAGPAGCAAAITLARAGWETVVIDKARFPRDKVCGDGLMTSAVRRLAALGVCPDDIPSWQTLTRLTTCTPRRRTLAFSLPETGTAYAASARRAELDAALVQVARGNGVQVIEGAALRAATQTTSRVRITAEQVGTITARYAIGADGVWSPLAKRLGLFPDGYGGDCFATRRYVHGLSPDMQSTLWLGHDERVGVGYAWCFPLGDGTANAGWGYLREPGKPAPPFHAVWHEVLRRGPLRDAMGPAAEPLDRPRGWPLSTRLRRATLAHGRVHFVGDACGATNPATGEGIGQALLTGSRSAEAIIEAGPADPARAAERYRRSVRRELLGEHVMSTAGLHLMRSPMRVEVLLRGAAATPWTRRRFVRWLFEDRAHDQAQSSHGGWRTPEAQLEAL